MYRSDNDRSMKAQDIGYEAAGLTVHPPPRMIEGGFIFFVWVSPKLFPQEKSGFCRRYSHWNAPKRGFTS